MKNIMLGMLAITLATTTVIANGIVPVKKANAKQATCTSCPQGQQCAKTTCTKADCCK
ncbi:MAG: hypothetical protein ABI367_05620 [Mucilaginibacter sp.]